jgi:hypothetical protein
MTTIPDVQRAWIAVRRGKPADAIVLKEDWPVPKQLEEGEVLVQVQAGAFNPMSVISPISIDNLKNNKLINSHF